MITVLTLGALLLSVWLGLSLLAVVLQWRSLYPTLRCLFYIPFGFLVVLCTHGLLTIGAALACWLTISC